MGELVRYQEPRDFPGLESEMGIRMGEPVRSHG